MLGHIKITLENDFISHANEIISQSEYTRIVVEIITLLVYFIKKRNKLTVEIKHDVLNSVGPAKHVGFNKSVYFIVFFVLFCFQFIIFI